MKPDKHKKGGPAKGQSSQQSSNPPKEVPAKPEMRKTAPEDYQQQGSSKSYSRRKIVSNWDKYEEPTVSITYQEPYEPQGDDFNKLLQMPASADSHLVLKSEELEPPPCGSLFALDLKNLADGLATIPFYKQVDIPVESLSKTEVENMDQHAELMKLQLSSLPT
ncbi:cell death regulator Aven-like [Neocloeon triangulifer]|uniref:cell death regulator Aven-like n=1 Tax=Neocloeon triangulifer TaxID=2078957 RepID=UPI00286F166F|nr:cell death regulator Aven-like [Neocloeon triangulifer]XP_059480194.1 cell death regulator Aven-like [Neocloeon triangulifer]